MPMTGAGLSSLLEPQIKSAIETEFGTPDDETRLNRFAHALAQAIGNNVVTYIQENATVLVESGPGAGGSGIVT